jgi:protocatechuate 3,4-dioxygenase beta subunit
MFTPIAIAQTGSGNTAMVSGIVRDERGHALSDAVVFANSAADVEQTRTDQNGRFIFLSLIPSEYRIEAVKPGYGPYCMVRPSDEVELSAGLRYRADIRLVTYCR